MKKYLIVYCSLFFVHCFLCLSCAEQSKIKPTQLTCEYMTNPAVVDVAAPRLSWINEAVSGKVRGEYQQAYRICVASSKAKLLKGEADIWDSGKTPSRDSYLIPYAGSKLQSAKDYWWRVMVWDSNDVASTWSAPACWGMGLLSPNDWKAQWIGAPWQGENPRKVISTLSARFLGGLIHDGFPFYPAPLLRKSFQVKDNVAAAKVFVTGLGFFEFYLNGKKVGDDCLVPNLTNYTVRDDLMYEGLTISIDNNFRGYRVMYLAYDITDMLRKQQNVAGAILGDGFYDTTSRWMASFGSPRFLCQIEITYKDGTKDVICSDETWKVKESPIVMNGVFDGEIYDANLETDGWATTACDDSGWANAILREAPTGVLNAHTAPTDKVAETLNPVTLTKNDDGTYEVDFGLEVSGWIRFRDIQGKKGDTLQVKYICESPLGVQKYVFKGGGKESYAPRFTWYVFRKAVISGIDRLTPAMLTAEAVNTDVKISAEFRTSNPLFDQINTIWQRSQLDNMHGGIASDCPHRERAPYTGDGQVACVTVMHNFEAAAFYEKWIRDMRDAQHIETGYVPNGAPWQPGCGGGVPWGAAMNIMPWEFYLHYGDSKMLEDNYVAMKEYVRYMLTWLTDDGTMYSQRTNINSERPNRWLNLGDWAPAYQLPPQELVHTFYLWRCADFTARAAKALNKGDDYVYFTKVANDIKAAFHKKFYDAENKTYGDFGSNVFALVMGVPREYYRDILRTWRQEIVEKYDGHLNTGIFGTQFFFEMLAAHGMNDVAYEAMNKRDFPSYGHWIELGATVTWEHWNGNSSRNHPMFGGGLNWFYRTLAGVNADENEPGYKHIIIRPDLPEKMDYVYYSNSTPYGKVTSEVKKNSDGLEMNITVPVGSYATVYIPVSYSSIITESGQPIEEAPGIEKAGVITNGHLTIRAAQGTYKFAVKNSTSNVSVEKKIVKINKNASGAFELLVDGKPEFIKGAVGNSAIELVKKYGGNAIRSTYTKERLDEAHVLGLMALVNLPVASQRGGFDYEDTEAVKNQHDRIINIVRDTKDHPAVLMWALGNELDHVPQQVYEPNKIYYNMKVWDAVNDLAKAIHEIDPDHPVMTVVGSITKHKINALNEQCPDLDLLGVNEYGDLLKIPEWLREYGWKRPYQVTEWGPTGFWQTRRTPWGYHIEETGSEKADKYKERYEGTIVADKEMCLGSYVFLWRQHQEYTHTWFGMFDGEWRETEAVDVMRYVWTGEWPPNRAPRIKSMTINGKVARDFITLVPGEIANAQVDMTDPDENDVIRYEWELLREQTTFGYGGGGERKPESIDCAFKMSADGAVSFTAPSEEGPYRLFVTGYDKGNHVAFANIPVYVGEFKRQ